MQSLPQDDSTAGVENTSSSADRAADTSAGSGGDEADDREDADDSDVHAPDDRRADDDVRVTAGGGGHPDQERRRDDPVNVMEALPGLDSRNENDYIVIDFDEDDPTRFVWRVHAGNHYLTHRSKGSYSRRPSAVNAATREHPGVRVVDRTKPQRPSIPR